MSVRSEDRNGVSFRREAGGGAERQPQPEEKRGGQWLPGGRGQRAAALAGRGERWAGGRVVTAMTGRVNRWGWGRVR